MRSSFQLGEASAQLTPRQLGEALAPLSFNRPLTRQVEEDAAADCRTWGACRVRVCLCVCTRVCWGLGLIEHRLVLVQS